MQNLLQDIAAKKNVMIMLILIIFDQNNCHVQNLGIQQDNLVFSSHDHKRQGNAESSHLSCTNTLLHI